MFNKKNNEHIQNIFGIDNVVIDVFAILILLYPLNNYMIYHITSLHYLSQFVKSYHVTKK